MTNEEFIESIRLEGEEWRDVVGYEGRYMVSSLGRVLSTNRDILTHPYGNLHIIHRQAHLLKPTPYKNEYLYVMFRKDERRYKYVVHRLVAQAFLPNEDNLPQVDHIDGNHQNNEASNLRWCTPAVNMSNPVTQAKILAGRDKVGFPYRKRVVKLSNGKVVKIYDSVYSVRNDGYNPPSVNNCCHNRRKSHGGFAWMFLSDYETLVSMSKNSTDLSAD